MLKQLVYLNLALNNITRIEGLESCENLAKLDLTVNFIDTLKSLPSLNANENLRELYLVGNPCTGISDYRIGVVQAVPMLAALDGIKIEKSERILAAQKNHRGIESLDLLSQGVAVKKDAQEIINVDSEMESVRELTLEEEKNRFNTELTKHTPEARLEAAKSMEKFHEKPVPTPKPKRDPRQIFYKDGRPLQKNEGGWDYNWDCTPTLVKLHLKLSKFLDTSFIDVEFNPEYLLVLVKGKSLVLTYDCADFGGRVEVSGMKSCERSKLTGELCVTLNRANPVLENPLTSKNVNIDVGVGLASKSEKKFRFKNLRDWNNVEAVSLQILGKGLDENLAAQTGTMVNQIQISNEFETVQDADFEDNADVPPLC